MVYPPLGWSSQRTQDAFHAQSAVLNVTAATALKTSRAVLCNVIVVSAGSATAAIYDSGAIGSAAASNRVFTVPPVVGVYTLALPCTAGVTVMPGAGMQLSVSLA